MRLVGPCAIPLCPKWRVRENASTAKAGEIQDAVFVDQDVWLCHEDTEREWDGAGIGDGHTVRRSQ